ncbi:MAG TPA: type ISP restriction/modification enzyme [Gemmataceae bacterium]|nr:type ISP restriction/modification enzyme [Gemmataceae bacterium]
MHRPPPWLPPRRRTVGGYGRKPFAVSLTHAIADLNFYADPAQCFPFDVYDEDGSNRREKITDWALKQFRSHYQDKKISKWDVFHDVYGLLHHPGDRTKFADNLKKSLPRIPFAPDFRAFATAGKQLADLHVNDEQQEPHPLTSIENPDVPYSPTASRPDSYQCLFISGSSVRAREGALKKSPK